MSTAGGTGFAGAAWLAGFGAGLATQYAKPAITAIASNVLRRTAPLVTTLNNYRLVALPAASTDVMSVIVSAFRRCIVAFAAARHVVACACTVAIARAAARPSEL